MQLFCPVCQSAFAGSQRCPQCGGRRFNRPTLEIRYRGHTIADVLDLAVDESLEFFENFPAIRRLLSSLSDVGLGYMTLGQASTTLSGGESQRVKLAAELARVETGRTLYLLDEPTTGLHFRDIQHLIDVLERLVDRGNTVIVIEHHLDVIKRADEENVMVYAIGFAGQMAPMFGPRGAYGGSGGRGGRGTPTFTPPVMPVGKPDAGLATLAGETGGGYFEVTKMTDLAASFKRVADELHHQYVIGFAPTLLDGKTHHLAVKVKGGLAVRARRTYLAIREQ